MAVLRSEKLEVKMRPWEKEDVRAAAERRGVPISEFVRKALAAEVKRAEEEEPRVAES